MKVSLVGLMGMLLAMFANPAYSGGPCLSDGDAIYNYTQASIEALDPSDGVYRMHAHILDDSQSRVIGPETYMFFMEAAYGSRANNLAKKIARQSCHLDIPELAEGMCMQNFRAVTWMVNYWLQKSQSAAETKELNGFKNEIKAPKKVGDAVVFNHVSNFNQETFFRLVTSRRLDSYEKFILERSCSFNHLAYYKDPATSCIDDVKVVTDVLTHESPTISPALAKKTHALLNSLKKNSTPTPKELQRLENLGLPARQLTQEQRDSFISLARGMSFDYYELFLFKNSCGLNYPDFYRPKD